FGFLLVNEKGYAVLERLVDCYRENIAFVSSYSEMKVAENYFEVITQACSKNNLDFIEKKNLTTFLDHNTAEISGVFTVGWQFLLPQELDQKLEYGIHVFHDSLLPKYRGFAPTPSAIINGEKEIGVTLLRIGKSIDDGPIFGQKKFDLNSDDYVKDAIRKLTCGYIRLIEDFLAMISSEKPIIYTEQDESKATYSIWRDEKDYEISWDRTAEEIRNLIRATGSPYMGACSYLNGQKLRIHKADVQNDIKFEIRNSGKVWKIINENTADVVCGQGILRVTEVFYDISNEKFNFTKIRSRFTNN
ncbi:hypothetical protein JNL27_15850, partial [bacterium]|nr:hypothetical protein [bacterium]